MHCRKKGEKTVRTIKDDRGWKKRKRVILV